jgi:hypothetical protein
MAIRRPGLKLPKDMQKNRNETRQKHQSTLRKGKNSKATQNLLKGHRQNSKIKSVNQRPMLRMGGWCNMSLSAIQQSQELFASLGARAHASKHTASSRGAADLLHAAHNHAKVRRFHDNTDTTGLEDFGDCQGNLLGQALLDLKSAGKHLC